MNEVASQYVEYHAKGHFPFGNLTFIHHDMFSGSCKEITTIAAAVELLVLSYDIFDDLEDKDNDEPPWMKDDEKALNIATGFIFAALSGIQSIKVCKRDEIIKKYCKHALIAINGQHVDLTNNVDNESNYIEIMKQKSGTLTALACILGVLAAGQDKDISLIEDYATNIGIAAQIRNDLKDVLRLDRKSDLINRKKTLATLYLLEHPDPMFNFIREYYQGILSKQELLSNRKFIESTLKESGVILYSNAMIKMYQNQAIEAVNQIKAEEKFKILLSSYI
ncbi:MULTISPECIES: polyprenyl synthetase family protein [Heyndrickxia]|uniref:Uncharacterized protein n=1 Tax=Heyndrickxia sporothermodurans TaxID=46224 RepID=A0A150KL16_9BACI|nr:polyprenyl synthetase family protein [Heyndrickxia sporothermodurans]KYC92942.1 hypothetical protein B4102_2052 [Heyndrickxia sporothermodurans]